MRLYSRFLVLCLTVTTTWAAAPTITPINPVVQTGETVNFNADQAVTWSMLAGSTGSIHPATGVYTAPATQRMKNVMDGCPLAPNDSIFNTKVNNLPVHAQSAIRIAQLSPIRVGFELSFPRNTVTNSSPTEAMSFLYTGANNGNYLIPQGANSLTNSTNFVVPYQIEGGVYTNPYGSLDRHLFTINQDDCSIQEFYKPYPIGSNPDCPLCNGQAGMHLPFGYRLSTTGATDAAGLPILPLTIHYEELRRGLIQHALRFTMPNGFLCSTSSCGSGEGHTYVWPATANAESGGGIIPYGSLLRLKSDYNISGYSAMAQVILTALKDYGAYLADGGNSYRFQSATDVMYETDALDAFNEIFFGGVRSTDFEYVDQTALKVSDTLSVVNPENGLVVPENYAWVQACNAMMECSRMPVAVQGITIGRPSTTLDQPVISVMAGAPAFQIPIVVHGTSNTGYSCVMGSLPGSLTFSGVYTAPASQSDSVQQTEVICSTAADPTIRTVFQLDVYPADGIRVDMGGRCSLQCFSPVIPYDSNNNYGPDEKGKYWWYDRNRWPRGYPSGFEESYPQSQWADAPDIGLWYSRTYADQDLIFPMHVPNGSYTLRLLLGEKASPTPFPPNNRVMITESQGEVLDHDLDICTVMTPACRTGYPGEVKHEVVVTDNNLYFALRRSQTFLVYINGWSIVKSVGATGRSQSSGRTIRTGRTK